MSIDSALDWERTEAALLLASSILNSLLIS